ncbi:MAG: NADAR family protein [Planctomycetes bacterium]|nr:NADAR family protein [Planctomycetota bacterium]
MTQDLPRIRDVESLERALADGHRCKYVFFWGHQKAATPSATCFSQWYDAPFTVDGTHYATAEHYMMAGKARLFGDDEHRAAILACAHPGEAKKLGRRVRGFDPARWESARFELVVEGNVAKFSQHDDLRAFLLATGERVLVEASPYDRIWGIGLTRDHDDALNPSKWRGLNLLGFALMEVRERLRGNASG